MQPLSNTRITNRRRPKTSKQERVCSICSKAFSKAEHLARHYRSHTKEKPFQCTQCGRVYTRQDTLLRHARSHCPLNEAEQSIVPMGGRQGHHDPQITAPLHMMRMEGTDVAMERSASSSSSSSMRDITVTRKSPVVLSDRVDTTIVPVEGIEGGGTNVSPILTFTSPLSQNLGTDFQVDGGLNPLAISNIELESGWSSWLMGSDFDLDGLNSSLLEATAGDDLFIDKIAAEARPAVDSFSNGPQAADTRPTPGCEAIRRKWHTYCERTPSDTITSDSSIDGTQIDESYRNELADRLQPRVQPGILPSTTFLHLCLQAYFTHFNPNFPLIHEASFHPSKPNAVLLLSICSVGSLFLGSRRAIDHGISMFERLQKAVLSSWDAMLALRPDFSTAAIQSALLGQTFSFLVGRPKDLAGIEAFHGSIISMARRARLFNLTAPHEIDLRDLAEDALQSAWMKWISIEEKKRIVLGIFIHDAELAKLNHHEPSLRPAMERLPVPSSHELFAAPNAIIWKTLVLQCKHEAATLSTLPSGSGLTQDRIPEGMSEFGLCSMLESISALACECSISYSLALNTTTQKCQEMLMRWYETHGSVLTLRKSWTAPLMILWHSTFILLYANLDTLERACGRDGPEAVQESVPYAREWANSHEARRCLFHAVWIRRHFESMSIGCEFPLHMPTCLYHCGIVWFCSGQFGAQGKPPAVVAQDQVAFPELSLLGVDGNRIVADEIKNSQGGWNACNQVFRIVGLLQRIPHWKLSSHLASTLLALVEEQDNIF